MTTRSASRPTVFIAAIAMILAGVIGVWAQNQDQPQAAFAESIEVRALAIEG